MIRILHVVSGMTRGGIETFLMNIYRKIDKSKIQFDFLVSTMEECEYDNEIIKMGGIIHRIHPRNEGIIKNHKEIDDFFKKHKEYKIVHQHVSSLTYIEPLKSAKKYKVPVRIVHSHNTRQGGNFLHKYMHKFNQFFIESYATHYFACSHLAAKWLYSNKQFNLKKYEIINNAIDTEEFVFDNKIRAKKRKELGIEDNFVLGHVGRFMHQKNHDLLIDIFKSVHERQSNAILLLVGEGKLKKSIKNKVKDLNLEDFVIFTGVRTDIPELLQAMDIFLMPSYHEGLPVTLVEAQASGLPCVLSDKVTKEVEISNIVKWCSLSDSLTTWTKSVLYFREKGYRSDKKQEIIDAGYDAGNLAKELEKKYINFIMK